MAKGFYDGSKKIDWEMDKHICSHATKRPLEVGQFVAPTTVDEILERLGVAVPTPKVEVQHVNDIDDL